MDGRGHPSCGEAVRTRWGSRLVLLAACAALAAGCSAAETRGRTSATTTTTTVTTTTTTQPPAPPTVPRPADETGARCQAVIEERLAELAAVRPPDVDAVCRHRDSDPGLGARGAGAYYRARFGAQPALIVIGYPRPGPPGWEEAVWRAAVAHELGHAWDAAHLVRPSSNAMYREIPGPALVEPIEDYADVFAAIVGGVSGGGIGLRYIGTPPPAAQVDQLCAAGLIPC